MKIHLVTAEHFRDGGIIHAAFASHDDALAEAVRLTSAMVSDHGWNAGDVNTATFNDFIERLQDYHGAAHCYVEIAELEVFGRDPLVALLKEAVEYEADQFDGDPDMPLEVSGADTVDWLTDFRLRARKALKRFGVEV